MRVLRNFNQIPRAFADSNFLGRLRVSQERNQDFSKEWGGGGGGGGESHCVTPGVLTRLSCRHPHCVLLKVHFFRMSRLQLSRG